MLPVAASKPMAQLVLSLAALRSKPDHSRLDKNSGCMASLVEPAACYYQNRCYFPSRIMAFLASFAYRHYGPLARWMPAAIPNALVARHGRNQHFAGSLALPFFVEPEQPFATNLALPPAFRLAMALGLVVEPLGILGCNRSTAVPSLVAWLVARPRDRLAIYAPIRRWIDPAMAASARTTNLDRNSSARFALARAKVVRQERQPRVFAIG